LGANESEGNERGRRAGFWRSPHKPGNPNQIRGKTGPPLLAKGKIEAVLRWDYGNPGTF